MFCNLLHDFLHMLSILDQDRILWLQELNQKKSTRFFLQIKLLLAGDGAGTSVIDVCQWDVPQVAVKRTKPHLSEAQLIFIGAY